MSNKPLLIVKLPYVDDNNTSDDVLNHMVKTLNSTFRDTANSAANAGINLLPVGSVIHSMLTESQFQTIAGAGWVLMDGRSVAGSSFAVLTGISTLPDASGRFLRGKGANNPDGSLALGTRTAAKTGLTKGTANSGASTDPYISATSFGPTTSLGNETAPDNITVNIFIKIN